MKERVGGQRRLDYLLREHPNLSEEIFLVNVVRRYWDYIANTAGVASDFPSRVYPEKLIRGVLHLLVGSKEEARIFPHYSRQIVENIAVCAEEDSFIYKTTVKKVVFRAVDSLPKLEEVYAVESDLDEIKNPENPRAVQFRKLLEIVNGPAPVKKTTPKRNLEEFERIKDGAALLKGALASN